MDPSNQEGERRASSQGAPSPTARNQNPASGTDASSEYGKRKKKQELSRSLITLGASFSPFQQQRESEHPDPEGFQAKFKKKPKASWHTSAIDWHDKWNDASWEHGRVLIIDYIRQDRSSAGKTKIAAQEIPNAQGLHQFYSNTTRCKQAALRVIHVQNAPWAVWYLLKKFNISNPDDLLGMDFGKFVKYARPEWRGGKPLLKGKAWRTQRDPWRAVKRTAFGLDYVKACGVKGVDPSSSEAHVAEAKMMELNGYDDVNNPTYCYDAFVQRIGVYVQYHDGAPPPDDVKNPYLHQNGYENKHEKGGKPGHEKPHLPLLESLDNGNTIIIFENSRTQSVKETLIGARQQIESRWRRLSFYLPQRDLLSDNRLALECMDLILEDIFKGLAVSWESFLTIAETHISILEDKIYESPADESRAPELWYNSSAWLKVERLMYIHQDIVKEVTSYLIDLSEDDEGKTDWLDGTVDEYQKLANLLDEDLTKPTAALSDLMYKSVGIRDSRHSLQLSTSMWRLSWITFIFLPLTFVVGFFGMNVDTFSNDPSIKWWFVVAVPLLVVVLVMWYLLKHWLATRRQTPYQRGVYEHLFHDLAVAHPGLWSRTGPRQSVQPVGTWSSIKWRLISIWFAPSKTIRKPASDPDEDNGGSGLGGWARFKRMLAREWSSSIQFRQDQTDAEELGEYENLLTDMPAVGELVAAATPAFVAEGEPKTHNVTQRARASLERLSPPAIRDRSSSPRDKSSTRPSSSGASSGMMVEEIDVNEDKDDGGDVNTDLHSDVRRSIDGVMGSFGNRRLNA